MTPDTRVAHLTATTIDRAKIAFQATGTGPELVFLHDLCEDRLLWEPIIDRMSVDHQCIWFDTRGHGDSSDAKAYDAFSRALDAQAVLAAVGARYPLVVGHGQGVYPASILTMTRRLRGLVLVGRGATLNGFDREIIARATGIRSLVHEEFTQAYTAARKTRPSSSLPPEIAQRLELLHLGARAEIVRAVFEYVIDCAGDIAVVVREFANATIAAPLLEIHGSAITTDYRAAFCNNFPLGVLESWDGLGHHLHLADPDRFCARLRAFSQSCRDVTQARSR